MSTMVRGASFGLPASSRSARRARMTSRTCFGRTSRKSIAPSAGITYVRSRVRSGSATARPRALRSAVHFIAYSAHVFAGAASPAARRASITSCDFSAYRRACGSWPTTNVVLLRNHTPASFLSWTYNRRPRARTFVGIATSSPSSSQHGQAAARSCGCVRLSSAWVGASLDRLGVWRGARPCSGSGSNPTRSCAVCRVRRPANAFKSSSETRILMIRRRGPSTL